MKTPTPDPVDLLAQLPPTHGALQVGIDTVQVSHLEASLRDFGARFEQRLFTEQELATVDATPAQRAERLAARFAAKEAAIKAFGWSEAGVNLRDIEVVSEPDGRPWLRLHAKAAQLAAEAGRSDVALSLSHDGDQACAVVATLLSSPRS